MHNATGRRSMLEKDPTTWSLATWLLIFGMSLLSGVSRVLTKARDEGLNTLTIISILADLVVSGLVCLAVFMILVAYDQPPVLCAAIAGMCGHMATRILFVSLGLVDKIGWLVNRVIESKSPDKKE